MPEMDQDTVFSLILGRVDLRGYCLFIYESNIRNIGKRSRSNTVSRICHPQFTDYSGSTVREMKCALKINKI